MRLRHNVRDTLLLLSNEHMGQHACTILALDILQNLSPPVRIEDQNLYIQGPLPLGIRRVRKRQAKKRSRASSCFVFAVKDSKY